MYTLHIFREKQDHSTVVMWSLNYKNLFHLLLRTAYRNAYNNFKSKETKLKTNIKMGLKIVLNAENNTP